MVRRKIQEARGRKHCVENCGLFREMAMEGFIEEASE